MSQLPKTSPYLRRENTLDYIAKDFRYMSKLYQPWIQSIGRVRPHDVIPDALLNAIVKLYALKRQRLNCVTK